MYVWELDGGEVREEGEQRGIEAQTEEDGWGNGK